MSDSTFQFDVFLSHNRSDKHWVELLAERIEAVAWKDRRLRVFLDAWDIRPGDNIPITIERALQTSRKIAVVLSPAANQAPWVELERSIVTLFDPANRQRRLLPLLLAGSDEVIPPLVRPLKYIDFRTPQNFDVSFASLILELKDEPPFRTAQPFKQHDPPLNVSPAVEHLFLHHFHNLCCICGTQFDLHLFSIDPLTERGTEYNSVIALCTLCHDRLRTEEFPPRQIDMIKKVRTLILKEEDGEARLCSAIAEAYSEAIRLSLSTDPLSVKKAAVLCRRILMIQPFHIDAETLLAKLGPLEQEVDTKARVREKPAYSTTGLLMSKWLTRACNLHWIYTSAVGFLLASYVAWAWSRNFWVAGLCGVSFAAAAKRYRSLPWWLLYLLTFLPAVLLHEVIHLFYVPATNAAGQRMPFLRRLKYLEAEFNGVPIPGGFGGFLREIFRNRHFPAFRVNHDRLLYEWYWDVDLRTFL